MNGQYVARENMKIRLAENPYPGRGIVLGTSRDGRELVQIYWLMGRSENSRNRVLIDNAGRVSSEIADQSKVEDPSLIIYDAMIESFHNTFVVSNGDQTGTVIRKMGSGHPFMDTMYEFSYEQDSPHFTPRITGAWSSDLPGCFVANFAILRKSELSAGCDRFHYQYQTIPSGFGYCLTTYAGDGNPLPAFQGEPFLVTIPHHTIESVAYYYWERLNVDNQVALAVKYITKETGWSRVFLINRYKKVE